MVGLITLMSSCSRNITTGITTKDSTVVRINYRDTTVYTQKDSVIYTTVLKVDSVTGKINLPKVTKKSKNASVSAEVKNDTLIVEGNCDSLALVLKLKDTEIERLRETKETKVERIVFIPGIYKFSLYFLILFVCVSIGYIIWKFKMP